MAKYPSVALGASGDNLTSSQLARFRPSNHFLFLLILQNFKTANSRHFKLMLMLLLLLLLLLMMMMMMMMMARMLMMKQYFLN